MHELAICRALIAQVDGIARERCAQRVLCIVVRVGPLSGVEAASLRSAYPLASTGTVAENATLLLEECPVRVRCRECGAESEVPVNNLVCRSCGQWRTDVLAGDELLLVRVELEKEGVSDHV